MGFGRIGRSLMRVALKDNLFVPVSISDIRDVPTLAALFEVDSNYGRWPEDVTTTDSGFVIGGREIPYFDSMKSLPDWKALGVDLVIDCTGRAHDASGAQAHLDAGAKRVLVSAPSKNAGRLRRGAAAGHQPRHVRSGRNTRSSAWRAARPTRWPRWSRW